MKPQKNMDGGWWMMGDEDGVSIIHHPSSKGLFALGLLMALSSSALANPVGMTAARGSATATQNGSQLSVKVSNGAVLNWRSFNIQRGETTTFVQPSSTSVVWNRVMDPNLSQIYGNLNANGWVVLMNQNGFYFGPNSVINVGGLMVTTSPIAPESAGIGGMWQFNGTPPLASIINYGEIKAQAGGSVFLVSERVENHGTISAPGGKVGLYAGKEVLISERPDARGISATVKLPKGSVDNSGKIIADAGTIALHAQVVNQNGVLQANSVRQHKGVIELVATEEVKLGADSILQAKGEAIGVSQGGTITVKSDQVFSDQAGSKIEVGGGAQGGNGGNVELSAPKMASVQSQIDGTARKGWKGGTLVFDPTDIILSNDGTDSAGSGTVLAGDNPDTLHLNVNSAFAGFSQIRLEATRDISLDPYTAWNLNNSTGINDPGSMLTLEAGRNIVFGDNSQIQGGAGWSVRLAAGVDFSTAQHSVRNGVGGIYFNGGPPDSEGVRPNGNGALQTAEGSISLEAGHEILVGGGYIRTVGGGSLFGIPGGNIDIKTGDGDVDAGTKADGYTFTTTTRGSGYDISASGLGGIGTAYGGNVIIHSGHDILSFAPTVGAYGAGDVTLTAANRIVGKFIVRDGTGTIEAGTQFGSSDTPASLSLIKGGWTVHARDIFLNEVLNPNGVFNQNFVGALPNRVRYKFDYAPDAYVKLNGDNSVQLLGNHLALAVSGENSDRPPIYAPQLEIHAGAGGVVLGNDLVLYPSPLGHLQITTTDGGSLRSLPGSFHQIVMSDSGSTDYKTFATAHATTPLHLNGPNDPVSIIIDGNVENVFLRSPKRSEVSIGGYALNFSFEGQNLNGSDVSRIDIGGNYFSRSDRTVIQLSDKPTADAFYKIYVDPLYVANKELAARLSYNAATGTLTYQGKMTDLDLKDLLAPKIIYRDQYGLAHYDADGNPVTTSMTFTTDKNALNDLSLKTQDIPTSGLAYNGLQIGGPGSLSVSVAQSAGRSYSLNNDPNPAAMDLGISHGMRSVGALLNQNLANVFGLQGANLTLDLAGDLKMTASQIASFNGGNISVTATHGGNMNVGSQEQFTSDDTPKGIFTAHGGDVSVTADGKIDINGSRIATYDGGNVTVTSLNSDVDAGGGARGSFTIATLQRTEKGDLEVRNDRFFGSGIVALTRPASKAAAGNATVGNISVSASRDILASAGGILQLAFNKTDISQALIDLNAGRDIVANQSGVLGANINLHSGRDIIGLVVGSGNVDIKALNNVSANVLGGGNVGVSGNNVSGNIVGGGSVGVSGVNITANVVSTSGNATTSGNVTGTVGALANAAAPVAQQTTTELDKKNVTKTDEEDEEQKKKRAAQAPVLSKTTGRVTVILPSKS